MEILKQMLNIFLHLFSNFFLRLSVRHTISFFLTMEVNISSGTKITRFTRENDIASNIRYCP